MNLLRKLRAFFRKETLDREMSDELRHHLDLQTEANVAAGMSSDEAHYAAQRQFGHVEGIKETARDQRGWMWLEQSGQDLRFGARQLRKAPGFASASILTFALGIGACTALFSVVNRVVLHPLDYPQADRIMNLWGTILPKFPQFPVAPGTFHEWVRQSTVFESLALTDYGSQALAQADRTVNVSSARVTFRYFDVYGLKPVLGRLFLPEEMQPGHGQVAILTYSLWQANFGGRANVVGEQIRLNDKTCTVIGVVHDSQRPLPGVYLPNDDESNTTQFAYASGHSYWPIGRLKRGVTVREAQTEMNVIANRLAQQHPDTHKGQGIVVKPEIDLWVGNVRPQLYALLAAVAFLLLIACVNVANLLLARANARQKEIALRAALGAGRMRVVRQFLCESLLIAVAGGLLGIGLAYASMPPLISLAAHFMPNTDRIAVDGTVLVVMCSVMLLAGLGFGLVPALQATRGDMIESLKEGSHNATGGRSRQRVRNALVVIEVSVALVLLIGTGLMIRSLRAMQTFDQGVRTENVYTNWFTLTPAKHYDTPEKILGFTRPTLERIQALPDVQSAAFTVGLPMGGSGRNAAWQVAFILDGQPMPKSPSDPISLADGYAASPDYFHVMSIPLIRGRGFTAQDTAGAARVVLINREMAQKCFPNVDPIGRRIRVFTRFENPEADWAEIVGIVGDVKPHGPTSPTNPQIYRSFDQSPNTSMTLVLRTRGSAAGLAVAIGDIVHSLEKSVPLDKIYDYEATISYSWIQQRFNMILFTLFAGIALLLAAIGIYGVMAYAVSQRTHEIGVRMALGALPRDVLRLVLAQGARVVGLGLVLGTAVSLAATRLLSALLFNTSPYDPVTFAAILIVLSIVALLACWLSARRATKVDPMIALRCE